MPDNNDWDSALEQMKQVEEKLKQEATKQQVKAKQKRNPLVAIFFLAIILLVIGAGAFVVLSNNSPAPSDVPRVIEADPTQFDPQISLETVQRFAGDNLRFLSLTMTRVHPDGTVDFSSETKPTVEYTFVTADEREFVIVSVAEDLSMSKSSEAVGGLTIPIRVEPPSCDIPQLWQLAKTYDVPNTGVADVHYDTAGYNFVITSLEINLQFNGDCILIRS